MFRVCLLSQFFTLVLQSARIELLLNLVNSGRMQCYHYHNYLLPNPAHAFYIYNLVENIEYIFLVTHRQDK